MSLRHCGGLCIGAPWPPFSTDFVAGARFLCDWHPFPGSLFLIFTSSLGTLLGLQGHRFLGPAVVYSCTGDTQAGGGGGAPGQGGGWSESGIAASVSSAGPTCLSSLLILRMRMSPSC